MPWRDLKTLTLAVNAVLAAVLLFACEHAPQTPRKPNILLIVTDDQGWGDFGFNANPVLETPVLDRLAREGVRFDRFYVSPVCSPTRASLLTGRHFLRTGVWSVTRGGEKIRGEEQTLAELFADAGYRSGLFGKWHNGAQYPFTPDGQGFDTYFGFVDGHLTRYFDADLLHDGRPVKTRGFVADVVVDNAIEFIRRQDAHPFLALVAFNTPHSPFEVPTGDFEHYREKGLSELDAAVYGLTRNIDNNVGRLLDALRERDLREETLVVMLSDNGPAFPGGNSRYNGGLRGRKGNVTEGGIRVPLVVSWPDHLPTNRRVDGLAQHVDILPTLADLANLDVPDSLELDGLSLLPLMESGTETEPLLDRMLFTSHFHNTRRPDQIAIRPYPAAVHYRNWNAVRESDGPWELYDLENDPGQIEDMAGPQRGLLTSMIRSYDEYSENVTRDGFQTMPAEAGHDNKGDTTLPAHEAAIYGASFDYAHGAGWAHDWLISTGETSGFVSWPLRVVRDGRYRLVLGYAAPKPGEPPTIEVDIDERRERVQLEHHLPAVFPGRRVFETGEAVDMHWNEAELLELNLATGGYEVELAATQTPTQGGLLIKYVRIEPP